MTSQPIKKNERFCEHCKEPLHFLQKAHAKFCHSSCRVAHFRLRSKIALQEPQEDASKTEIEVGHDN